MAAKALPPTEYLHECFIYDPDAGALTWRSSRPLKHFPTKRGWQTWTTNYANQVAGSLDNANGYLIVWINCRSYKAHRLIWMLKTGKAPSSEIDHRNGDKSDNRWENLREATKQQNAWNRPRKRLRALPKGVYASSKSASYFAAARAGRKLVHIGTFNTPEEASDAHRAFTEGLHGDFHHPD